MPRRGAVVALRGGAWRPAGRPVWGPFWPFPLFGVVLSEKKTFFITVAFLSKFAIRLLLAIARCSSMGPRTHEKVRLCNADIARFYR